MILCHLLGQLCALLLHVLCAFQFLHMMNLTAFFMHDQYKFNIYIRSSSGSCKVVICNIHVLYNPRRGEIKLGQVFTFSDAGYADFFILM
jgi:hypothetical protein